MPKRRILRVTFTVSMVCACTQAVFRSALCRYSCFRSEQVGTPIFVVFFIQQPSVITTDAESVKVSELNCVCMHVQ